MFPLFQDLGLKLWGCGGQGIRAVLHVVVILSEKVEIIPTVNTIIPGFSRQAL